MGGSTMKFRADAAPGGRCESLSIRRLLVGLLGEPVVQFLLLGALLYGAMVLGERREEPQEEVVVTAETVAGISQHFARRFGRSPTSEELDWLVERHVRDEVFFREGVALELAEGDEIVRRRIVQKMEFLSEGEGLVGEPTEAELQSFHAANALRYASPARVSFVHRHFSPDADGEAGAHARAEQALARLRAQPGGEASADADRFPDRERFERADRAQIERAFGRSELTGALFELPLGTWAGPLHSGFGWHLVRIIAREAPQPAPFAEVAADVRADWQDEQRARHRLATFAELKRRYRIVREDAVQGGTTGEASPARATAATAAGR